MTKNGRQPLLSVRHLRTEFSTAGGTFAAVDDVSFDVDAGQVLSIVGESGSGKSVTALSLTRLLDGTTGSVTGGEVWFDGTDLLRLGKRELRQVRGSSIGMVFQEPMSALNPVFTIGDQIAEMLIVRGMNRRAACEKGVDLLEKVRIPSPRKRFHEFPHQLSGGMRQRAVIAMAIACNPRILIADEPTTALDVTVQAQILELLQRLREETGMAMILITHDLGIVASYADQALVMYCGRVAESAPVSKLFANPVHPYTLDLLGCIPPLGRAGDRLKAISGVVPNPRDWIEGCRYATRCQIQSEHLRRTPPASHPTWSPVTRSPASSPSRRQHDRARFRRGEGPGEAFPHSQGHLATVQQWRGGARSQRYRF